MTAEPPVEGLTAVGATAEGSQRVDRWLWVARFFKTRALARKAIDAGKVEVNGARAKAARAIGAGDRLRIGTPAATFEVVVGALNTQRRPASEARQLYTETEESRVAREREAEARRERRGRWCSIADGRTAANAVRRSGSGGVSRATTRPTDTPARIGRRRAACYVTRSFRGP